MKKILIISLIIIVMILIIFGLVKGGCFGPKNYSESDSGTTIEAKAGQQFTISLKGNATTGFTWQMAKGTNSAVVTKVKDVYTAENSGGMSGVGGTHVWTFKAIKAGTTKIKLLYQRTWEKSTPPANTLEYTIKVSE
jgi:inhibitor of cysteine peptidase